MQNGIKWRDFSLPVEKKDIDFVNSVVDATFPNDYLDIVKKFNGGLPDKTDFEFLENGEKTVGMFGILLGFKPTDEIYILDVYEMLSDQLPIGILPIIDTGGGDYVCFDYGTYGNIIKPAVVYWTHDVPIEESVSFLSSSFSEFLEMLYRPKDDIRS